MGNALQALLRFDDAEHAYNRAVALRPQSAAFLSNLSVVLTAQGRLDEALQAQSQALALDPTFVDANYNHAVTLLMAGQYEQGWQQYEWRWQLAWSPPRGFAQPQWSGEDLAGKTILLHPEQGLGDTLQMMRFAPMVGRARRPRRSRGAAAPCNASRGRWRVWHRSSQWEIPCPRSTCIAPCSAFRPRSVCGSMRCPASLYLAADTTLVRRVGLRGARGLRVGLVWRGAERIGHYVNEERSIPLERLAPLLTTRGASFFSLQLDPGPDGLLQMQAFGVTDLMPGVEDFADTAAQVQGLDLVISVDTSTAHLAAAMGKPVWLLSRYNGCWRWMKQRSDSPWYPSMRIWRQDRPKDWDPVIARVAAALRVAQRRAA